MSKKCGLEQKHAGYPILDENSRDLETKYPIRTVLKNEFPVADLDVITLSGNV